MTHNTQQTNGQADIQARLHRSLTQLENADTDAELLLAAIFVQDFQARWRVQSWESYQAAARMNGQVEVTV